MRNTSGSTTRIYKHCSRYSSDPLNCTFKFGTNISNQLANLLPNPSTNLNIPQAPTNLISTIGNGEATISFTPGLNLGPAITNYLYSIDGVNYLSSGSISSPIRIPGLTNGVTYNITLKAVNTNGTSSASNSVSVTPSNLGPLAPVLTGVSFKTTDTITLTFTQASNGITITNYKYSIDDGNNYTAFSPVNIISPVTISGLSSNTTYKISLKAVSAVGESDSSNTITETTYANVNYVTFTETGTSTWTAPDGVTEIEYLVVGGGGGGGGTYSRIENIGFVSTATSSPGSNIYWINTTSGTNYGKLYKGTSSFTSSNPVRLTASQTITPDGARFNDEKWQSFEAVYILIGSTPYVTNTTYVLPQRVPNSTYSNNISAGSGGGGGGHLKTSAINPQTKYQVVPGSIYNLYVGAGGAGGTANTNVENKGSDGEASYFDTIVATGGAGGNASRVGFNQNGGGGLYSSNIMGGKGGASGGRNVYAGINAEVYQWNTTILRGTYGGQGAYINFDRTGNKIYGAGGDGGASNTPASGTTIANVGKGGSGTGATLNSFANGIDGGSGLVEIKYYT